jgi:hypothetical protein
MTKHVGLALAALVLVCASIGNAQVNATVGGTVTDPTGAVVPAVTVTATNVNTGIVTTRQTNESGNYDFPSLQPGTYTVSAAFAGFRTATFKGVELGQGQQVRQNFSLSPADANQSVEVVAEADTVLGTTTASVGSVLADKLVASLPVLSRNVMDMVATSPGVVTITNAFGASVPNFSGAGTGQVNTTRDGLVTNDGRYNDSNGAYSAIFTSPDMVEEVRISTNSIDPAAGRGIGQVQLRTRAGTNEFHGAVFYGNNNSALSSNNWFNNQKGAVKGYENRNQYGGRIGGPVIKNKAFFFALIDNQRYLAKELISTTVLTEQARQGIFRYLSCPSCPNTAADPTVRRNGNIFAATPSVDAAGNVRTTSANGSPLVLNSLNVFNVGDPNRRAIDQTWFGPQFLKATPLPNDFTIGDGLNTAGYRWYRTLDGSDGATGQSPNPNRFHLTTRGDYQINDNHRVTFTMSRENNKGVTGQTGLPDYPGGYYGAVKRNPRFYTGAWTAVLNATLLNDFRVGFKSDTWQGSSPFDEGCCFGAGERDRNAAAAAATKAFPNTADGSLIYVQANVGGAITAASPTTAGATLGLGSFAPFGVSAPRLNKSPLLQFADTVTVTRSAHNLQFGFELNRFASEGNNTGGQQTTRPFVTLGISAANPVVGITSAAFPSLQANDQTAAQQLLASLSGSVANIQQQYFVNSPTATDWSDYRTSYFFRRKHLQNDFAFYGKDSWKVTRNLTLNIGLRYDKYGVVYDDAGLGGRLAGGQSGAFGISGTSFATAMWNPYANSGSLTNIEFVGKNSPNPGKLIHNNDWNNFAPSIGFAYNLPTLGGHTTVLRGGYGINYAGAADFLAYSTNIAGLPGINLNLTYAPPTYTNLANLNSQNILPVPTGGVKPFEAAPVYSPAGRSVTINPYINNRVVPYIQNFNFAIQREIIRNMTLDVSYVGNKATKLYSPQQVNENNILENGILEAFNITRAGGNAPLFDRLLSGKTLTAGSGAGQGVVNGTTVTGSDALRASAVTNTFIANGDVGAIANFFNTTTTGTGVVGGLIRDAGLPANFIVANPQFGQVQLQGNNANSTYHAAQFVLNNRFSRGLSMQTSYVFSKNLGDGTTIGNTLRDPRNRSLGKTILSNNRTHIFKVNGSWELPFGKNGMIGRNAPGWANHAIGNWTVAPVVQWVSGAPLTFTSARGTVGFRTTNTADLLGSFDPGAVNVTGTGVEYFSGLKVQQASSAGLPTSIAGRLTNQVIVNSAGQIVLANPVAGRTGTTSQNLITGPSQLGFNMSLAKKINVTESKSFSIRADVINMLNHPIWGNPTTDINSLTFGRITTAGGVRTVTLNARFDF